MSVITEQRIDFDAIKESVSMVQILDHYGLTEQFHRSSDGLRGACPLHNGHNKTQFRVSLSQNCWHCFGDCCGGGSVLDFVSRKQGVTLREAAVLIQQWFSAACANANGTRLRRPTPVRDQRRQNIPLAWKLNDLNTSHPYLRERGLSDETIGTFGLGLCTRGMMVGRIVIPIHNAAGQIVAYAGRWPGESPADKPRYLLPRGFQKSLEVFNYHRATKAESSNLLIVVEGFFACMKLWQGGFRRVVSIMGSTLSPAQTELIVKAVGPRGMIILMFDEDGAGRAGRLKARAQLSGRARVKTIEFDEEGTQPDHLTSRQLLTLLR